LARQLYDFQRGAGAGGGLMSGVIAKLNEEDMVSLVAYAASLKPRADEVGVNGSEFSGIWEINEIINTQSLRADDATQENLTA
jgi:hypothetical protein